MSKRETVTVHELPGRMWITVGSDCEIQVERHDPNHPRRIVTDRDGRQWPTHCATTDEAIRRACNALGCEAGDVREVRTERGDGLVEVVRVEVATTSRPRDGGEHGDRT